jgi:hypothetical protein
MAKPEHPKELRQPPRGDLAGGANNSLCAASTSQGVVTAQHFCQHECHMGCRRCRPQEPTSAAFAWTMPGA